MSDSFNKGRGVKGTWSDKAARNDIIKKIAADLERVHGARTETAAGEASAIPQTAETGTE